jgi:peroxiredoxin Q/BCP
MRSNLLPRSTPLALAAILALAFACNHETTPAPSAPVATAAAPATVASAAVPAAAAAPAAIDPANLGPGSDAPDFAATASDGTKIQLSALKGKPVVVYFYPKDETPGCTTEACSFRDAWNGLSAKGVVLIGVSADSDESHVAFAKHHKLPFLLVSDTSGAIARQFGVPVSGGYESRQSIVIGRDGKVKKVYRTVDVTAHAAQIAADVQ